MTAVSARESTLEASNRIYIESARRELRKEPKLTGKDTLKLTWTAYIPTAIMAGTSIACVLGAHFAHIRREAALIGLAQFTERVFSEYREEVKRSIGEKAESGVTERVNQKAVSENPPSQGMVLMTNRGSSLFKDAYTGRYFESDMEDIRRAVNDFNSSILSSLGTYAPLNDFYALIGLARISGGDDVGWYGDKLLDVEYTATISEDSRPCIVLYFRTNPIR